MLSVQSFCLKDALGADLPGTIRRLHEIGYDSFEPLLVFDEKQGKKPANLFSFERLAQLKPILDSYGMAIPTAHAGIGYGNFFMPTEMFTPIGEGRVHTKEVLALMSSLPHAEGRLVVDQDRSTGDIMDDIERGYQNIQAMLAEL